MPSGSCPPYKHIYNLCTYYTPTWGDISLCCISRNRSIDALAWSASNRHLRLLILPEGLELPTGFLATAIMSEYISQACVACVQLLGTVPPSVFLLSLAAGVVGFIALVSGYKILRLLDPRYD